MSFVRVRSAKSGDPAHEFDVAEAELAARPFLYSVVDEKPVSAPRPVKYVAPKVAARTVSAGKPKGGVNGR